MKNIKTLFSIMAITAILSSIPFLGESAGGIKKGKFIDYYGGGSLPQGAICCNAWANKCVVGDRKTYELTK